MIRIDDTLLEEIGLISLPKPDRDQLLRQIYETLEMRVGMRLAERMTDQQLDEFESFIDTNDEAGALKWLETNFPDYKQVVADELAKLKEEVKGDAPKILQAMQAQAAVAPQQTAPPVLSAQPAGPVQPAPAAGPVVNPAPVVQPQPVMQQPFSQPAPQPQPPQPPVVAQPSAPVQDNVVQGSFGNPQPVVPQPQPLPPQPNDPGVPPPPSTDSTPQQPPFAA